MGATDFLYKTGPGRMLLRPLVSRGVSRMCGAFLDTGMSRALIGPFARRAGIDPSEYDLDGIRCFNDFFCRPLKSGRRIIDPAPEALIAPCDGLLTAVRISRGTVLPVKQSRYTLERLLGDKALAAEFDEGLCLVYRLRVDHYHRYCYFDSGTKGANVFLEGVLHTVRPVALADVPVFTENCREYTVLETESFGRAVQMEVGAMLVGRIVNRQSGPGPVVRGEEKGHFAYGGSTVIVLLSRDAAALRPDIIKASAEGAEVPVKMGETVGTAARKRR